MLFDVFIRATILYGDCEFQLFDSQSKTGSLSNNFKRKRKPDDIEKLEALLSRNQDICESLINREKKKTITDIGETETTNTAVKKFMPLIRKGFERIADDKFNRCSNILKYI